MALFKETKQTTVVTKYTAELNQYEILKMLGLSESTRNVKVYVQVPGGGDYGGYMLDIEGITPVIVEYEIVEEY